MKNKKPAKNQTVEAVHTHTHTHTHGRTTKNKIIWSILAIILLITGLLIASNLKNQTNLAKLLDSEIARSMTYQEVAPRR